VEGRGGGGGRAKKVQMVAWTLEKRKEKRRLIQEKRNITDRNPIGKGGRKRISQTQKNPGEMGAQHVIEAGESIGHEKPIQFEDCTFTLTKESEQCETQTPDWGGVESELTGNFRLKGVMRKRQSTRFGERGDFALQSASGGRRKE